MSAQSVTKHATDNAVAPAVEALILMDARKKSVMLPAALGNAGLSITVKNTALGGQTTLRAPAGATIDGQESYVLGPPLAAVRTDCDGANWWVTASAL